MSPIIETVVAGVISGLLATFLVVAFRTVWVAMIYPHIENCLYGDVRIDGEWQSEFSGVGGTDVEFIHVVQVGHHVSGTMRCAEGPDQGREFTFEGTFRNGILTGMYVSKRSNSLDRGTFALKIENNGDRLLGYCIYYKDQTGTLEVASRYAWDRRAVPASVPRGDVGARRGESPTC